MSWFVEEISGEGFVVTDGLGAQTAPTDKHIVATLMCDWMNHNNVDGSSLEFSKVSIEEFEESYEEFMNFDFPDHSFDFSN